MFEKQNNENRHFLFMEKHFDLDIKWYKYKYALGLRTRKECSHFMSLLSCSLELPQHRAWSPAGPLVTRGLDGNLASKFHTMCGEPYKLLSKPGHFDSGMGDDTPVSGVHWDCLRLTQT